MSLGEIVCCPKCRSDVDIRSLRCSNAACTYAEEGFPTTAGQAVLIDFAESVFERGSFSGAGAEGATLEPRRIRTWLRDVVYALPTGKNRVAPRVIPDLIRLTKAEAPRPRILVVGGGTIGSGTERLYTDPEIELIGTDVYASAHTVLVADGHRLPFKDGSFDAVVIQAVLEHVLEPHVVAAEIYRVLKPRGLVYADTPFMQQVHMGAYDFTRFTQSGHRWLFRRFEQIEAGAVAGAGISLLWAIRYFARALGVPDKISFLVVIPFLWLRLLDRARKRADADAASSTYFFGRKSEHALGPKDIIAYYGG